MTLQALWSAMESSRALSPRPKTLHDDPVDTPRSTTMGTRFRLQLLPIRDSQSLCSHGAKVKFSLKKKKEKKVCKPAGQYTSYKLTISTNTKFKKVSASINLYINHL